MQHPESIIQQQVITWLRCQYPKILFTATTLDSTSYKTAKRRKAMGYRPGTPDLAIYEARGVFHGLFIEMKAPAGTISKNQEDFISALTERGYCAKVCYSLADAQDTIVGYLALKDASTEK